MSEAPAYRLVRPVVFVGMMGSGKTAIGRALATRLGVGFVDSDAEIERAADRSIAEIFARDGEAFFRDREAEVLRRLLDGHPQVISTGGGAFLAPRNREAIAAHGLSVWLDAGLGTLWERVRHKDTRPLLRTEDPKATLTALYQARVPVYALAAVRVRIGATATIEETTDQVVEILAARDDTLEPL